MVKIIFVPGSTHQAREDFEKHLQTLTSETIKVVSIKGMNRVSMIELKSKKKKNGKKIK